jgi:hypothetical protein
MAMGKMANAVQVMLIFRAFCTQIIVLECRVLLKQLILELFKFWKLNR